MFVIIIESSFHLSSFIFHLSSFTFHLASFILLLSSFIFYFSSFIFICWRLYVRHKIVRFVTLFSANFS